MSTTDSTNAYEKYDFKRDIYFQTEYVLENCNAVFLLGARKTGKTVCLKQLAETLPDAYYYDIKSMNDDDADDLRDEIVSSIQKNERRTYLVDETTYWLLPEKAISKIANAYTDCQNTNTRVVFTGSQSVALKAWASRAFGGNAKFINVDFLSYPEWLEYKGLKEVSEETYNRFLLEVRGFYKNFVSLDEYLQGCLDETILSNYATSNIVYDNNCHLLTVDILKNILYSTLVAQSDRPSLQNFFDREYLFRKIRSSLKEAYRAVGSDTVRERIDSIFAERLTSYSSLDFETLKQGFIFLHKCGLVTLTYVSSETQNFENIVNVPLDLCKWDENKINNKDVLFSRVNACIKYPMFYAEILKEVLGEYFPSAIKGDILGGIVECHTRGLLPLNDSYEYHKKDDGGEREVDYVNFAKALAVEIAVRNKGGYEIALDDLPDYFEKILITKDQNFTQKNGLKRILYYQFIYELSEHISHPHILGNNITQEHGQLPKKVQKKNEPTSNFEER